MRCARPLRESPSKSCRHQRTRRGSHLGLAVLVALGATSACGSAGRLSAATSSVVSTPAAGVTGSISQDPNSPTVSTTAPSTTSPTPDAPVPIGVATGGTPDIPGPGACHTAGVLPDHRCTPGASNPAVTSADLATTICARGWTSTVRPPESYTEALKGRQMISYGDPAPISAYEEDHLIPLELGGAPSDVRNLWPEPGASPNPKDRVEYAGRTAVCSGRLSLAAAQVAISSNWVTFGEELGLGNLGQQP